VKRQKKTKNNGKLETIQGQIDTLFYSSPNWSAGRLESYDGESISFAGSLMIQKDDRVKLFGNWTNHPQYGRQFQVDRFEYDMPLDLDGLAYYLANHPKIKGIGQVKAGKIAKEFGSEFETVLLERPEEIAACAGLAIAKIKELQKEWQRTRIYNTALTWLSSFGLTFKQVSTLVDKFGNDVVAVLKENPYLLIREIRGYGFKKIDKIARKIGLPKDNPHRISAGLHDCMNEQVDAGHCWIDYEDLIDTANELFVMDCLDSREIIEKELDKLIDQEEFVCQSHGGRFIVARPDLFQMETDLHKWLKVGNNRNPHFEDFTQTEIDRTAPTLNPCQRNAVLAALSSQITLISGGAGSGKTFTVGVITELYRSHKKKVILAAPTGKAAKRMEQVVGGEAYTIHRLLGYDGKNFNEESINSDAVIIDEVSMVDVPLAWHLFKAIDLENTAVILVGDHNQLPPVGPGNILRDLIDTKLFPCVVLDEVVRQAGILKENSIAILRGEVCKTASESSNGRRPWYLVNQFTDALDVQRFIVDLFETTLHERLRFDLLREVQMITPTKKGPLGVAALNVILQQILQKKLYGIDAPAPKPGRRPKFLLHDKVIQTRNNYELEVMNGSMGIIENVIPGGGLKIRFEDRAVEIESGSPDLSDISLAYALTIHKVQGSEFPCVVVIIHKAHTFMHNRNLFYTAVTRARQSVVIIGDQWGLRNCAQKKLVDRRRTFLSIAGVGSLHSECATV